MNAFSILQQGDPVFRVRQGAPGTRTVIGIVLRVDSDYTGGDEVADVDFGGGIGVVSVDTRNLIKVRRAA